MSLEKIREDRLEKLNNLKAAGVDVYPAKATRQRQLIGAALENFDDWARQKKEICLAGRLRLIRVHGGSTFANLEDISGQIQIYFKQDQLGEKDYALLVNNFDMGDFVETVGELFQTQKGERTLLVKKYRMLAKALSQLPDKWHGLQDVEERFRRRYLDLLMNKEIKTRFKTRSEIIKNIRKFLEEQGFMEVETPILQTLPGGALAKPFETHLNALDMDLYLRVAPELYLKRLLVGGFEKVYELGRCFRNEGMDKSHNPDFTMLEFYWAYANYEQLMALTEELLEFLVLASSSLASSPSRSGRERSGPELEIEYQGNKINLTPPFKRITMRDLLLREFGLDIDQVGEKEIMAELAKQKMKPEDGKHCRAIDTLFKAVRPKLIEPTFVIDHPLAMSPLAKEKLDAGFKKHYAERFQLIVGGVEIVNAYTELNDPQEQARRMKEQVDLHGEDVRYDQDFVEALEYGLPPAAGWGLGVDRLVMLLTDAPSLREIILFPAMREK